MWCERVWVALVFLARAGRARRVLRGCGGCGRVWLRVGECARVGGVVWVIVVARVV